MKDHAAAERLQGRLDEHKERCRQLAQERQGIMQQQAQVLRGYVMAGLQLPSSEQAPPGKAQRELLVSQLVQEETAARAALEALKQGAPLAKAREIGVKVLSQAQELQVSSGGATYLATGAAPVSVFLSSQGPMQQYSDADDDDGSESSRPGSNQTRQGGNTDRSTAARFKAGRPSVAGARSSVGGGVLRPELDEDEEAGGGMSRGVSRGVISARPRAGILRTRQGSVASPPCGPAYASADADDDFTAPPTRVNSHERQQRQSRAASASAHHYHQHHSIHPQQQQQQQQQEEPYGAGRGNAYGAADVPPAYVHELRNQVASLQQAVESQLRASMQFGTQPGPSPGNHHMGAHGAHVGGAAAAPQLPAELAADPEMRRMHTQHVRDMTVLKYEVDRARSATELEQLRASLAELKTQGAGGHGKAPANELTSALHQLVAKLGQQQQQPQYYPPPPYYQHPPPHQQPTFEQQLMQQRQQDGQAERRRSGEAAMAAGRRLSGGFDSLKLGRGREEPEDAGMGQDIEDEDEELMRQPNPEDSWEDPEAVAARDQAGVDDERVRAEEDSVVTAAQGSMAETDVLQITVQTAGPFSKRGSYRLAAVLYEGFQPVQGGPEASVRVTTSKRFIAPGQTGPQANISDDSKQGVVRFAEAVMLRGVRISATSQLVFELWSAKPGVAGLPTKEVMVAWSHVPVLQNGKVMNGTQSLPIYRLPLMMSAQRKFTYDGALLDVTLHRFDGTPGESDAHMAQALNAQMATRDGDGNTEDIPGVPTQAWVRVQRGIPPADPFSPGDGFVVMVDAARFLPCNCTITKVVGTIWSSNGNPLCDMFEGVPLPESDALMPRYAISTTLGVGHDRFDDSTATLMLQVFTIDRFTKKVRVVGCSLLNVFLDPKENIQPLSRSITDYVLNQGAFQLPLHAGMPEHGQPLRTSSLDNVPRVPCASILVRILTPETAKFQRRKKPPTYGDRVYDTMRDVPNALERKLYTKYLQRRPFNVREACRLVAHRRTARARRTRSKAAAAAAAAAAAGGGSGSGFFSKLFGNDSGREEAAAAAAAAAAEEEELSAEDLAAEAEAAKAEVLPPSDPEIMDWMLERLPAPSPDGSDIFINYNMASEYYEDLGFYVAVDGAARLPKLLPSAALISYAPPGGFYQDHPVVEDVKVTLDYDMDAPLAGPRWLDGFQQFADVPYEPGLAVIIDVRSLVPASGGAAPAGWAVVPVFERCGRFVASGAYHLPLFQGVPSHSLLNEMAAKGDVNGVMAAHIQSGHIRPSLDHSSIFIRLMDPTRQGHFDESASWLPFEELRLPRYVTSELGAKALAEMRRAVKNKTYSMAKPQNLTDEQWVDQINDTIIKVAGLDEKVDMDSDEEPQEQELASPTKTMDSAERRASGADASGSGTPYSQSQGYSGTPLSQGSQGTPQGRRYSQTPPGSQGTYATADSAGTYQSAGGPNGSQQQQGGYQRRAQGDYAQQQQQQRQQQQQQDQQGDYEDEYEDEYEEEEEEQPVAYGPSGTPLYLNPQPDNGSSYQGEEEQYSYQGSAAGTPQQYQGGGGRYSGQQQQPRRASNLGPQR